MEQKRREASRTKLVEDEPWSVQNQVDMLRAKFDMANDRPKEKLQSQLNTIMPMEIVRAQPFFS